MNGMIIMYNLTCIANYNIIYSQLTVCTLSCTLPHIGYEPADLTVHPPPRMIESGFIFFVWVSSATKNFSSKKKWIL